MGNRSKPGRKCVFIDAAIHGQLAAIVALRTGNGERDITIQGMADKILQDWLDGHPVASFVPVETDRTGQGVTGRRCDG